MVLQINYYSVFSFCNAITSNFDLAETYLKIQLYYPVPSSGRCLLGSGKSGRGVC